MENKRLQIMKSLLDKGKTLEVGVRHNRITKGDGLDCVKEFNPTILCDLNDGKIPCKDNTYDMVIAGEVLEHLINPYQAVREFYRIIKPNGTILISTPNINSFVNRIRFVFGKIPTHCSRAIDRVDCERHVVDFNLASIKDVLRSAGFVIENTRSNGIYSRGKTWMTKVPASFGECLIIKARKPERNKK